MLDISAPRNTFPLLPAHEYLFVAGGIGITPVLPMLRAATASGATTTLAFAGRSTPFADELRRAHGDRVRIGRPDLPALAAALDPAALVYCCGPEPMLAEAEAVFPADRLHVERFRPRTRTFEPDTAFEAVCARSGRTVPVEADESLLDALRFAGLPVAAGCREGVCGSCEVRCLDGRPEHRATRSEPPTAASTRACPAACHLGSRWTCDDLLESGDHERAADCLRTHLDEVRERTTRQRSRSRSPPAIGEPERASRFGVRISTHREAFSPTPRQTGRRAARIEGAADS
ncbi:flavin reductase family protein [Saccharopolyspora tripterygii]